METLDLNFGHWATKSGFLTHTELLNNWRPKDNFCFDPISDRQVKKHLLSNSFCAPIFVLFFLYFKSRGQISRVRCAVVTRLPASEKLVPSTLREVACTQHIEIHFFSQEATVINPAIWLCLFAVTVWNFLSLPTVTVTCPQCVCLKGRQLQIKWFEREKERIEILE